MHLHPTPSPEINALLEQFLIALRAILGKQLVSLYCTARWRGRFQSASRRHRLLVATTEAPVGPTIAALAALHERRRWFALAAKLEGSYFPLRRCAATTRPMRATPTSSVRPLRVEQHESDWLLQMHVLRERGIASPARQPIR